MICNGQFLDMKVMYTCMCFWCADYGYWGAWGAWSKCTKKCHQGRQYRKRICNYKDYSGPINKIACVGHGVLYRNCNKDIPCDGKYFFWYNYYISSSLSSTLLLFLWMLTTLKLLLPNVTKKQRFTSKTMHLTTIPITYTVQYIFFLLLILISNAFKSKIKCIQRFFQFLRKIN